MSSQNQNQEFNRITLKPVLIYFKAIDTGNTTTYLVYPDWNINQFINAIQPLISIDFNVDEESFELIPAGQDDQENGLSIHQYSPDFNTKLSELFDKILQVSFYIRWI